MAKKQIGKRALAFLLLLSTLFTLIPTAFAETLSDGKSKTVTIQMNEKFNFLETTNGNKLSGYSWTYTTDTGIQGPAYCINWGLKNPPSDKKLTIAGKYTANPKTIGAFATGYPQRSLEDFIKINVDKYPEIANLTREEYACATQLAVWATLGQLAVEGTEFTQGRATLAVQYGDPQKVRTYKALEIMLDIAGYWSKPLVTGMHIRLARDQHGSILDIENDNGLIGAEKAGAYDIKKEVINGAEYYTRSFVASSATSTFKHDYFIELWTENAPEGTIFTGLDNVPLETVVWEGRTLWRVPTTAVETTMIENDEEYAGDFKICIPVRNTPPSGNVKIHATTTITQYDIYLANNTDESEQSYVMADPMYASMQCEGAIKWEKVVSPYGRLVLNKTDGMGNPLAGAIFKLQGADGSTFEGTSNSSGQIIWENLNPDVQYTLTETQAPKGFVKAEPMTVSVPAGQTQAVTVKNMSERYLRIRKIDAQDGSPLIGATLRIEQTDGSFKTDVTTTHSGVIEFKGGELPYGSYKVYEVSAPKGYQLDKDPQTFSWDGTSDITLTFKNVRTPSLVIIKMDKDTHDSLQDASFKVYKDGKVITTVTTDNAGYARVSGLTEGYYEVEETVAPNGYVLDSAKHGVHIDPYNPAQEDDPVLVLTNEKKPGLVIEKLDAETLKPMKGTTFAVYKDTTLIGEYKTDEDGLIELPDLEPGTYTVKEIKTDSGHVVQGCPQSVELLAGKRAHLIFFNQTKPGIHIKKIDSDTKKPLEGAVFRIEKVDGSFTQEYTTDRDGEIDLSELEPGAYTVAEVSAPEGYVIDTASRTFEAAAGGSVTLVFTNTAKPGMKISKIDADTGNYLPGAVIRITNLSTGYITEKTTDKNGLIELSDLEEGIYTVQEISAPSGYLLNDEIHHVTVEAGKNNEVVISNYRKPSLTIKKYDSLTGKPMADTKFEVYLDTTLIGTYETDAKGEIRLYDLKPGTYTVKEVAADDGHIVNSTPQSIEVTADGNDRAVLIFLNDQKPYMRLVKLDSATMKPLADAVFKFKEVGGTFEKEFTTDENGEIKLDNLAAGSYVITEIKAPDGYLIDDAHRIIKVEGNGSATFVFTNTKKPTMKITKVDADTGAYLPGAVVKITNLSGGFSEEKTTDENGRIELSDLEEGIYIVQEISAPGGYLLNDKVHYVKVEAGKNSEVVISNYRKPSLTIKKYDSLIGKPMAGTKFEVYLDTVLIGTYTTDDKGEIRLFDLKPGTYTVKEIATDNGHIVNSTPQSIEIKEDGKDRAILVFLNDQKPYMRLVKLDSETMQPLANAVFKFKKVGGTFEKEYTTDENGEIKLDNLSVGSYVVTEIKAPDGYLIDDAERIVKVEGNGFATFVFTDTKKPSIKILKYDAEKDKYLSGATFRIAKIEDGSNYLDRITDMKGAIEIDNLEPGVYSVKEIEAPSGYVLNKHEYHVELFPGKQSQLVVLNEEKPNLKIVKTDALTGEPIAGVGFMVKFADGSTENTVVTDENGEAFLEHLNPGVYEVIETSVPEGYLLDKNPQLVTLVPNRTSVVRFQNYPKPSLTVNKVDAITKDALKGAKFSIIYASNNTFTGEINDMGSFQTDENGQVKLYNLKDGWYKITETEAPDGYKITEKPQEIYIKAGENKTVTFENTPLSALVIKKVDAETGAVLQGAKFRLRYFSGVSGIGGTVIGEYTTSANGTIVINRLKAGTYIVEEIKAPAGYIINDAPETVYITGKEQDVITVEFENYKDGGLIIRKLDSQTKQPLSGAEFKVTTSGGELVGNQGGTVSSNGIYVTDASGQIHITGVEAGTTLVVTETKAPDGYVLDTVSQTVVIGKSDTQTLTFYNHPDSGLVITKLDKKTGEPLYGAVFKVTTDEGTVVGNANGRYRTDRNGMIHIYDLPSDTYIVTEIEAPDGYTLDSRPQTMKLKSGQTHELVFYNEAIGGIRITKLDEETRQPIRNVEFEVEYMNGRRVGTFRTNLSGVIDIDGLENGWYTIVEKKAAKGYQLDSEPHDVEVKDGKITRVTLTNRKASSFLIHKVDRTTGKGIYGVTFLVSDRYGNPVAQYTTDQNGYVYMDDFPLNDGKYFIREIAVPPGYVIDTEIKTFYVEYGATSSITWYNTPTQAQIQIIKKSADDNQINGLPAGSLLEGAVFEIYDRGGNVVDTVKTDKNGRASSKTLPLGLYTVRETVAPAYYSINDTLMTANLEFSGQIVTFEVLDKSVSTGVSIIKRGYNEVMPNNPIVYTFTNIANNSSVPLDSFYWRDTLSSALRCEKLVTGTYNQQLSYKIVYQTNLSNGEYRTINDNLSTSRNYALDISNAALGLANNEYITEILFVFGHVKAGFAQVETPYLYTRTIGGLPNGASFVNNADVGGVYNGQWITSVSRWVTKIYSYTHIDMPQTGY